MDKLFAKRMDELVPSGIRKVNEKALAMERAGETVIHFSKNILFFLVAGRNSVFLFSSPYAAFVSVSAPVPSVCIMPSLRATTMVVTTSPVTLKVVFAISISRKIPAIRPTISSGSPMFVRRIVVMMIAPPGTPGQPIATNTVEIKYSWKSVSRCGPMRI